MRRFRFLATFTALAALATALVACGGSGGGGDDPQQVVEDATLEGITSAEVDLVLNVDSSGPEGRDVDVTVSGPFERKGGEVLPRLDLEIEASGDLRGRVADFGGITLLADRAFVEYEGTEYEVDPTTFGFIKAALEQSQGAGEEGADPTACGEAFGELQLSTLVRGLKDEGSAEVDGTATTKLSGELDPGKAIDALIELTETPACRTQLEAAGGASPEKLEEARREVTTALKQSHVEIYVGEDEIIRRFLAHLTIEPKDGGETMEVEFELTLGGVNEPQQIAAPPNAKPVEILFRKLDFDPLQALEALGDGGDIGSVLEDLLGEDPFGGGLGGGGFGGGSGGEGSGGGASPGGSTYPSGGAGQQAYLECLQNAQTPTDLQNCATLQ